MIQPELITKVIFRVDHKRNLIALFPELPADPEGKLCVSYEKMGQHGAADYDYVINRSRPAKPMEYEDLEKELVSLGYNLKVYARADYAMHQRRRSSAP